MHVRITLLFLFPVYLHTLKYIRYVHTYRETKWFFTAMAYIVFINFLYLDQASQRSCASTSDRKHFLKVKS